MQLSHFSKALILTLIMSIIFVVCWEYYWRSRGFTASYNDDKVLWAYKRKDVYKPVDQTTVFAGGSRIKFDLDIATWKSFTGEEAIQLALVGTPGRLVLRDLGNDKAFRGKLIVDLTEAQFFGIDTVRRDKSAREALEYYRNETPAQKLSGLIDYALESKIVFLEEGKFGLTRLLNDLHIPNRPGVVVPAIPIVEFSQTNFDRQNIMTPMLLADSNLQKMQIEVWKKGIVTSNKTLPIKGDALITFLNGIKESIDKIRGRGGSVVFVRPPSTGLYLKNENALFPRKKYWDYLLEYTHTPGIYFSDYPETANFVCPENSHLTPKDAIAYTKSLIKILKEQKGWSFPKSPQDVSVQLNLK